MPKKCDMAAAHDVVSFVVVNFANTPLRAAQPPLAIAKRSHCVRDSDMKPESCRNSVFFCFNRELVIEMKRSTVYNMGDDLCQATVKQSTPGIVIDMLAAL